MNKYQLHDWTEAEIRALGNDPKTREGELCVIDWLINFADGGEMFVDNHAFLFHARSNRSVMVWAQTLPFPEHDGPYTYRRRYSSSWAAAGPLLEEIAALADSAVSLSYSYDIEYHSMRWKVSINGHDAYPGEESPMLAISKTYLILHLRRAKESG